jgi:hypothetical protein
VGASYRHLRFNGPAAPAEGPRPACAASCFACAGSRRAVGGTGWQSRKARGWKARSWIGAHSPRAYPVVAALGGVVTVRRCGRRAHLDGPFGTMPGARDMPLARFARWYTWLRLKAASRDVGDLGAISRAHFERCTKLLMQSCTNADGCAR